MHSRHRRASPAMFCVLRDRRSLLSSWWTACQSISAWRWTLPGSSTFNPRLKVYLWKRRARYSLVMTRAVVDLLYFIQVYWSILIPVCVISIIIIIIILNSSSSSSSSSTPIHRHGIFYATADEADAYMFYSCYFVFFCFFRPQKIWDNRSRERLNGFSWNFYQTIPGKMEFATSCRRLAKVVPPPGEWRMLMICVIYVMTLAQSPEGATHGGCVIKSWAREWI